MINAIFMMGGLGLIIGAVLATASKVFYVYVDPLVERLDDALPGANCGGCGLPGCTSNAEAIAAGKAGADSCVAGGAELAEEIAAILGVTVEAKEPDFAGPGCNFGCDDAEIKYLYNGINDCRAAALHYSGMKECKIGCLGFGNCVKACMFGALVIGPNGLPIVDEKLCTGCGACAVACPQNIISLTSVTRRILHEYTSNDCTTPCQRACPAGINIREYIRLADIGDYNGALQVIKERNPFPSVIGRICPAPCELECRRKLIDSPVSINPIKRFVADYERKSGKRVLPYKAPETDKKIAIIGGGVEGLTAAFYSARLGHSPKIFEATDKLGGLLRIAISKERLSHEILDWDIDGVLEMGVEVAKEQALGKDVFINSLLKDGYEAVFLASGGWDARLGRNAKTKVEELIPGTYLLIDLIDSGNENKNDMKIASEVVIVDGGKATLEAVKICKHFGVKQITVLFRKKRKLLSLDQEILTNLENEGVELLFNVGVTKISGEERELKALDYIDFETGEKKNISVKTLLLSSGRLPELIFRKEVTQEEEKEEALNNSESRIKWEGVEAHKQPFGGREKGLLSNSDVLSGYIAAVKALGAGRRAAASIHRLMYDIPLVFPDKILSDTSILQDVNHLEGVVSSPQQIMPVYDKRELSENGEIEKGFTKDMIKASAQRCLQCGLICYEKG